MNDKKYLHLGHDIGKLSYFFHKLIYKKVKAIGFPMSYGLLLTATYEILNPVINYTPLIFVGLPTIYIINYFFSMIMLQDYYNIKFTHNKLITDNQYINFSNKIKLENKVNKWLFKTNVPISHLKKFQDNISSVLKGYIVDIKYYNGSFNMIEITTSKYKIDYRLLAKISDNIEDKIKYGLKYFNVDISNLKANIEHCKSVYSFDCLLNYKDMVSILPELKHLTKLDLKLTSGSKKDFDMTIYNDIKNPSFFECLQSINLTANNNIFLGYDNKGNEVIINLRKLYHSLISGSTGKGKSNFAHVLISSIVKSNIDCLIFLLDTKKSELKRYRDISNVYYEGDKLKCIEVLETLVTEMDNRNKTFESYKFINGIDTYNKSNKEDKKPYIIIYIEEIADLLKSSDKDIVKRFNSAIERLTQLGRSSGFRLFLSTQYPKGEIINSIIKINCDTKFAFSVPSTVASNLILDSNSCVNMPIGKMIYKHNGNENKVNVPELKDKDIIPIVEYIENIDKTSHKPLSIKAMSTISKQLKNNDITMSDNKNSIMDNKDNLTAKKYIINNSKDLFELYIKKSNNEGKILSLGDTIPLVNISRTTIQKYRKELKEDNQIVFINQQGYIKEQTIKAVK